MHSYHYLYLLPQLIYIFGLTYDRQKINIPPKMQQGYPDRPARAAWKEIAAKYLYLDKVYLFLFYLQAGNAIRTRDIHLGKVTLYH